LDECIPSNTNVEEEVLANELSKILNHFIADLPTTERRVFLCRYWYLDSIETISQEFNFSNSKVKSMLYRTRQKLIFRLRQEGVE
jgi:RNA polymerase sigma-70 factor (ECF subfamily)